MTPRTIAVVAVLLVGYSAEAGIESDLVVEGIAAYDDLSFKRAIEILDRALHESLTREEKIATYRTLAFAHAALGHAEEGRAAFAKLLRINERFELDGKVAPRVRALFEEVRNTIAVVGSQAGLSPEDGGESPLVPELSPQAPREGQPLAVVVLYPGGVAQRVQLFHRSRGQARFSMVSARAEKEGRFEVTLAGSEVRAPGLEYYMTAVDENGAPVARAGTLVEPLTVEVAAQKKPLYKRPWFWGVIGGAVVLSAVVVAVVFTVRSADASAPTNLTVVVPP